MKKRSLLFMLVLAALVSVFVISGCDINNPVIDEWWIGETPGAPVAPAAAAVIPITTYTVTFNMGDPDAEYFDAINGNSDTIKSQVLKEGALASEPGLVIIDASEDDKHDTPPTKFFAGWYTAPDSGGFRWIFNKDIANGASDQWDGKPDKIISLYARWIEGTDYTVSFNLGAPTESGITDEATTYYDSDKNPFGLPQPEYVAPYTELSQPKGFDLADDTLASTYTFTGWYVDDNGSEIVDKGDTKWDFNTPVTENMILYAGWGIKKGNVVIQPELTEPPIPTYTVTFDDDDGDEKTSVPTVEVKQGDPVPKPSTIHKDGSIFDGWYDDDTEWDFDTMVPNANTSLIAKWTPITSYTVTFDMRGGEYFDGNNGNSSTIKPQILNDGEPVQEPGLIIIDDDPNDGHHDTTSTKFFAGWFTTPESGGKQWNFNTDKADSDNDNEDGQINGIIPLFARWSDSGFKVTFDSNGDFDHNGTIDPASEIDWSNTTYEHGPETEYVAANTPLSQPKGFGLNPDDPLFNAYGFCGWYIDNIGNDGILDNDEDGFLQPSEATKWNFSTGTVTGNMTLYAGWGTKTGGIVTPPEFGGTPVPTYTVTFDDGGADDTDSDPDTKIVPDEEVVSGDLIPRPDAIQRDGYIFNGWYDETDTKWDFDTMEPDDDTTLYARWTPEPITTYIVNFDMQGGFYVDSRDPPLVPREGPIPSQIVETETANVYEPGLVEYPEDGVYYGFAGWYTSPGSGGRLWNFDMDEVNATIDELDGSTDGIITLYAGWSNDMGYKVTFDPGGDFDKNGRFDPVNEIDFTKTTYEPNTVYIAPDVELSQPTGFGLKPDDPLAVDYAFTGWYIDVTGDKIVNEGDRKWIFTTDTVTGDMTLYAGWGTKTPSGVQPPGVYQPESGGTPVPTYTVTFEDNGAETSGADEKVEKVVLGDKVPMPDAIHKEDYVFTGWYKDSECKTLWDFNTPVTENDDNLDGDDDNSFTLYAGWELEPYTPPWFKEKYFLVADDNPYDLNYYPFQVIEGGYDLADWDHTGGDADEGKTNAENINNSTTVIQWLNNNPNSIALIIGYEDAIGDTMDTKRELSTWYNLNQDGILKNPKQLVINTKLPDGYPGPNDPPVDNEMIIGPNDSEGLIKQDGYRIKIRIYTPLNSN